MQTPIQKAIEQIDELLTKPKNDNKRSEMLVSTLVMCKNILQAEIPYEKECIYDAYDAGVRAMNDRGVEVRALCDVDDWFNETFNQTQ
jgi:hypothetical protein